MARAWLFAVAVIAACSYNPPRATGDAADMPLCPLPSSECATPTLLRECRAIGESPVDTPCSWGCVAGEPARCAVVVPSGGAVEETDLDATPGLGSIAITGAVTINTEDGAITGALQRAPGAGIDAEIEFIPRTGVGVFRFGSLAVSGTVTFVGSNAVALVSLGGADVTGLVDARGDCVGTNPGPGGRAGGLQQAAATGSGAGAGGATEDCGIACTNFTGGGGGGHAEGGAAGGTRSGTGPGGGPAFGDSTITSLADAGGGGGGGGGGSNGVGGGGGGALQLVANGTVTISGMGINAGGCGGTQGDGGGGGGAGGAVLVEAPDVIIDNGAIAVNGGAGGAGNDGDDGADGALSMVPAPGGFVMFGGGVGGDGGAMGTAAQPGENDDRAGGAGGAVGRIRINTRLGEVQVVNGGFTSPDLTSSNRGVATTR